jgi:hypothetical protein
MTDGIALAIMRGAASTTGRGTGFAGNARWADKAGRSRNEVWETYPNGRPNVAFLDAGAGGELRERPEACLDLPAFIRRECILGIRILTA